MGAYLTRGVHGGLVRGCRICKMPLNEQLACPAHGPLQSTVRAHSPGGDTHCRRCKYHVCSCPPRACVHPPGLSFCAWCPIPPKPIPSARIEAVTEMLRIGVLSLPEAVRILGTK